MQRTILFLLILSFFSCSGNEAENDYISEDSLAVYKKRDSLLSVLQQQLNEQQKEYASVVWAGSTDCNYLLLKTANWYYVAQNNYSGGVYKGDMIKAGFVQYGNMDAYNTSTSNSLSLFITGYYSTRQQAVNYIKSKCGNSATLIDN